MASLATYTFLCSESITCADVYKAHLHVSLLDVVGEPGGGIYSCHDLSEVIKMTVKWRLSSRCQNISVEIFYQASLQGGRMQKLCLSFLFYYEYILWAILMLGQKWKANDWGKK